MANIHVSFMKSIFGNGDLFPLAVFDSLNVITAPYRKWDTSSVLVGISEKSVHPAPSHEWKQIKTSLHTPLYAGGLDLYYIQHFF